jgi:quinol monooxygenase YgiN
VKADAVDNERSSGMTGRALAQALQRSHSAATANLEQSPTQEQQPVTITKGLIVRLEAKPGQQDAVAAFLRNAVPLVQEEPKTVAWFAFQTGASSFAIIDVFPDEDGRRAHLEGALAAALEENGLELLAQPPLIENVDALATKLP